MRLIYHAIFPAIFPASIFTGGPAAFGQTGASGPVIRAVIADSASRHAMPYVTIGVLDEKDAPVAAAYSKENVALSLQLPGRGHYRLVISSVGHRPLQLTLNATNGAHSMADTLFLSASLRQLGEVQVVARKQLIEQKPGMLVYNAGNDIGNKGGAAADVIRKAPALNVDPQGNVYPSVLITRVYLPGLRLPMRKRPSFWVYAPAFVPRMVTAASDSGSPEADLTWPETAEVDCATAIVEKQLHTNGIINSLISLNI
ncbi:hypothetical protein WJU16_16650 [Chitinophaga pollutisoli]|uniref:Carboxypeptidase regulatory-like domain-containing protein n=1 Tax=Chitinophaga pollutisoli TaxID=3133966 RepID=A0ABZ2YIV8_9BACT